MERQGIGLKPSMDGLIYHAILFLLIMSITSCLSNNHIYLTSTDGAYQYKNSAVVNIYK